MSKYRRLAGLLRSAAATAYDANRRSSYLYGPFGTTLGKRKAITSSGPSKKQKLSPKTSAPAKFKAIGAKTGRKIRRGMKAKRYRKKRLVKYHNKSGMNRTIEVRKSQTGADVVYVGHSTYAPAQIQKEAFKALVYKHLFSMFKINGIGVDDAIGQMALGRIDVTYRTNPTTAPATTSLTLTAGVNNIESIAFWMTDTGRPWKTAGTNIYESEILRIEYFQLTAAGTLTNVATFNILNTYVKVAVKSSLKMQNRTLAAGTGDVQQETDQVDVVPVIGKSYYGRGNTWKFKTSRDTGSGFDIVGDGYHGTIVGSDSVLGRAEPPQPSECKNVKRCGSVKMEPGEIKTSVLSSKFSMSFNNMMRATNPVSFIIPGSSTSTTLGYTPFVLRPQGVFRVFAVEKMIDDGQNNSVTIQFENNLELSTYVWEKRESMGTVKTFAKVLMT